MEAHKVEKKNNVNGDHGNDKNERENFRDEKNVASNWILSNTQLYSHSNGHWETFQLSLLFSHFY